MKIFVLCLCSAIALTCAVEVTRSRRFPKDFIFGTGTAAYQIEGAWDADDKSEGIWDYLTHNNPGVITNQTNGDVACDSYHKYKRDMEMMRELGTDSYRFSVAWSRILPHGLADHVSEAGIAYYNNIINELVKYNIQPMITLYHWDLPQRLQEMGGFLNPLIVDWFSDFARVVFENFGDRVKTFITFNEAAQVCRDGYGTASKAPLLNLTSVGEYICTKNLILAHAKAYHIYNNEFKPVHGGACGFVMAVGAAQPIDHSEEVLYAVELFNQFQWALYTDPICSKNGGFPKELLELVAQKSGAQGYPRTLLSDFTEEEKAYVRGTTDFFGVNHYTGVIVTGWKPAASSSKNYVEIGRTQQMDWPQAVSFWLRQMPKSLYIALKDIQKRYDDIPIYITENGWSTREGIEDDDRINYYRAALEDVLDALHDGINVKGYYAWSLMDNFEWLAGYTERFGLYEVDFEEPERTRTPRKSAFIYKQIIKTRMIDHDYEPESYDMTIDPGN